MELSNLTLLNGEAFDESVLGAVTVPQQGDTSFQNAVLHDFDMVVLMLHSKQENEIVIRHTISGELRTQTIYAALSGLEREVASGINTELITGLLRGEIIWDPTGALEQLRRSMLHFDGALRDRVLFLGFTRFLYMYVKSKSYMNAGCVMDAYNCILMALYHWARIEVGEAGHFPEPAVWEQVKHLNRSVHKLYEELTVSTETLEQRVQLVLLACEFAIMSKMSGCCALLLNILSSRREAWSAEELLRHPDLRAAEKELPLVLGKLASRSLVKELTSWSGARAPGYNIRYTI